MVKIIDYHDIRKHMYTITDSGIVTNIKSGKVVKYNNPDNNSGYCRITLRTESGGSKKYPLHRLVMATFTHDSDLEVNHKDGNKLNNDLSNLEYVTGLENKHHAKINQLYQSCDERYNAIFTNELVHEICKKFEQGNTTLNVMRFFDIPTTRANIVAVNRIFNKHTWCNISKYYNWDPSVTRYKKYPFKDLYTMACMLQSKYYTYSDICAAFDCYNKKQLQDVLVKMKAGKLYKTIMYEVKRSTTIRDTLYDCHGFEVIV